ncbi:hypothetical protein GW17_00053345 [Ensete ventricosum]|nr:hypothetical protein GW17_00053345 [Ensete ventricosum]
MQNFHHRFQNLGEMMTLGRSDAAITPSFIEGLTLEGPVGHAGMSSSLTRKIAYLFRLPTDEHRLKVGMSWLAKSAVDSVALFQTTVTKVITGSTVLLVARDGLSAVRPSVHFSTHGSDQSQVRKETTACIMLTAFSLLGSRRWNTCCSPAASISRASPSHPLRSSAS